MNLNLTDAELAEHYGLPADHPLDPSLRETSAPAVTPWTPCPKAIARVPNPLPVPTACRYCNGVVAITHHRAIYRGRTYGDWPWVYRCEDCEARVGMHPTTNLPLGTLADAALRDVRNDCKKPFEQLWRGGQLGRTQAYKWLAKAMGKSLAQCHFGLFEEQECMTAHQLCLDKLQEGQAQGSVMASAFKKARR